MTPLSGNAGNTPGPPDESRPRRNILLVLAYDGTDFQGWQRQPHAPTVQETVETALARILTEPVTVYGSGRTDAGVHAAGQVANFKTSCRIPCDGLTRALNDLLPRTVRVRESREVHDSFHARYDVRAKTYRYRLLLAPVASPFLCRFACHYPYPLNWEAMAKAARLLEGEHDFSSFAGSAGHSEQKEKEKSMVRTLYSSRIFWRPKTRILVYQARGSGFLHHMVRNIVGTLMEVGRGKIPAGKVRHILEGRDRRQAGPTAPPEGLCLWKVEYAEPGWTGPHT